MKKKKERLHRSAAKNHLPTKGDIPWRNDRTSAAAETHEDYVNCWGQAEAIKTEFQMVANSLARLGSKARKEDVINLMAWENRRSKEGHCPCGSQNERGRSK
jgi:hypothetical protein